MAGFAQPRALATLVVLLSGVAGLYATAQNAASTDASTASTAANVNASGIATRFEPDLRHPGRLGTVTLNDLPAFVRESGRQKREAEIRGLSASGTGANKRLFRLTEVDITPNTPSDEREPIFDPSGSFLAFASNGIDTPTRDTNADNIPDAGDGRIDALNSNGAYHIFVMNADGSGTRQVTGLGDDVNRSQRRPSWSPDGTRLVYTDALNTNTTELFITRPFEDDPTQTGTQAPRERLTFTGGIKRMPTWSSNTITIAFASNVNAATGVSIGQFDLFTITPTGDQVQRLTGGTNDTAGNTAQDLEPAFSLANPQALYFSSDRVNSNGNTRRRIYILNLVNGTMRQVTSPGRRPVGGINDEDFYPAPSFPAVGAPERLAFHTNSLIDSTDTRRDFNVWSMPSVTNPFPSVTATVPIETAGIARVESNVTSSSGSIVQPAATPAASPPKPIFVGAAEDRSADREATFARLSSNLPDQRLLSRIAFASQRRTNAAPSTVGASTTPAPGATPNINPTVVNPSGGPQVLPESIDSPGTPPTHDIIITTTGDFTPPILVPQGEPALPVIAPVDGTRNIIPGGAPRTFERGLRAGGQVTVAVVIQEPESGLASVNTEFFDADQPNTTTLPLLTDVNDDIPVNSYQELKAARATANGNPAGGALRFFDDGPVAAGGSERQQGAVAGDGLFYCEGTFATPDNPGDFYIDIIATDRVPNIPNTFRYDNIWGFSTRLFTKSASDSDLFVSDYTAGQTFRNGNDPRFVRILPIESYYLNSPGGIAGDPVLGPQSDPSVFKGIDVWRIQCRGAVPVSIFQSYSPGIRQQLDPADFGNRDTAPIDPGQQNLSRRVASVDSYIIWASPYTNLLFTTAETLADSGTQANLTAFLRGDQRLGLPGGGRLFISGRDVVFGLTRGGIEENTFLRDEMQTTFDGEAGGASANNTIDAVGGKLTFYEIGKLGGIDYRDAFNDLQVPQRPFGNATSDLGKNRFEDAAFNQQGNNFGTSSTDFLGAGPGGDSVNVRQAYTLQGKTVGQRIEIARGQGITSRAVLFGFGLEGVNRRYASGDDGARAALNVRAAIGYGLEGYFKTSSVRGRILNVRNNLGIPNFLVEITGNGQTFLARTNANGEYLLEGLPLDAGLFQSSNVSSLRNIGYSIRPAQDDRGRQLNRGFSFNAGRGFLAVDFPQFGSQKLTRAETEVNLVMVPVVTGSLRGVAVDANGATIPFLNILVRSRDASSQFGGRFAVLGKTDNNGRFSFDNLPPTTTDADESTPLEVVLNPREEDIPETSGLRPIFNDPNGLYRGRNLSFGRRTLPEPTGQKRPAPIFAPSNATFFLDDIAADTVADQGTPIVVPAPSFRVSGNVILVDRGGERALPGAVVTLLTAANTPVPNKTPQTTAANGTFAFADVSPGTLKVRVTITIAGQSIVQDQNITVTDELVVPTLRIFRQQMTGRFLRRRVTNGQSEFLPLTNALVRVFEVTGTTVATNFVRETRTDASGNFVFGDVSGSTLRQILYAPRTYRVRLAFEELFAERDVALLPSKLGTAGDFVVTRQSFRGTVTLNGVLVQGATVTLTPSGTNTPLATKTTNAQGVYEFPRLAIATYSLRASLNGETSDVKVEELKAGQDPKPVPIISLFRRNVSGVVNVANAGANGASIPGAGALVRLVRSSPPPALTFEATANAQGRFTFASVPRGSYVASASRGGDAAVGMPNPILVTSGANIENVVITLRVETISGTVTLPNGQRVGGANVSARRADNTGTPLTFTTGASGEYTLRGATAGEYILTASNGGRFGTRRVTIVRGQAATGQNIVLTEVNLPPGYSPIYNPSQAYLITVPFTESPLPTGRTTVARAFTRLPFETVNGVDRLNYQLFRFMPQNADPYTPLTAESEIGFGEGLFLRVVQGQLATVRPVLDPTRRPLQAATTTFRYTLRLNLSDPEDTRGFSLIGMPFNPETVPQIDFLRCRVYAANGTLIGSVQDAATQGLIEPTLIGRFGSEFTNTTTMTAFNGYFVRTKVDGLILELRTDAQ